MVSLSLFMLTNNIVNFIERFIVNHNFETHVFNFTNPVGITIYLLLQMILGYFLSRLLINTKRKSKEFLKMELLRGYSTWTADRKISRE